MNIIVHNKSIILPTLISTILAFTLLACSDEEKPKTETSAPAAAQPAKAESPSFDHAHGPEVTDLQKHKFEHDFAAQCVDRELNNSTNKVEDAERLSNSCECIAAYMMKDLTAQEAEKFLEEKEHPQSLRIKFEAAAYECIQEKVQPAGPKLFGKPQAQAE